MIYTKLDEKYIDEIDSNVILYKHNKTNAKIVTIKNDDPNKVFMIAFRTPAINDTGLTHILEHSVLCGSKKYPVKDPFVELAKGSLNTFLNAFTASDKTMYPIASLNLKDFHNLEDIYMDAVFNPLIYKHKEIFEQEGWHYELENIDDDIKINGVVYNEMKGAFSDSEQVLARSIQHSLFPDTSYSKESGGDPKHIPDLSYNEFIEFHKKYYSPSNSYIYLYGNLDMEEELNRLDDKYLKDFEYSNFDTKVKYQKPFESPKYIVDYYQEDGTVDKTYLTYNVALPSTFNEKELIAFQIITSVLLDEEGSLLKEYLMKKGFAVDIDSSFDDDLLQPIFSIIANNSNPEHQELFINSINEFLLNYINTGIDKKQVLAKINFLEFKAREKNFTSAYPKGLMISLSSLSTLAYDESPFIKLETIKYYQELKNDIDNRYFEEILRKYILENNHKTYLMLKPSKTLNQEFDIQLSNKLKNLKETFKKEELEDLVNQTKHLKEFSNREDTETEKESMPKLELSDLDSKPTKYNLKVLKSKLGYKVLYSKYHTNDIVYLKYYFDITDLDIEKAKYASLFTKLFLELKTSKYNTLELANQVYNLTGSLYSNLSLSKITNGKTKLYLTFDISFLKENMKDALKLLNNIMFKTIYSKNKLKEKLKQIQNRLIQSFASKGHIVSKVRAESKIDKTMYIYENISNISFLDFISNLVNNYDLKYQEIIRNLNDVKLYFTKKNFMVGITYQDDIKEIVNTVDKFYKKYDDSVKYPKFKFEKKYESEAITTNYNVNYVALSVNANTKLNGGIETLKNILNYDYLWFNVRVLGGAYGVFIQSSQDGLISFLSYRDPNIKKTIETYKKTSKFIGEINLDEKDLLKAKIGAFAQNQVVTHVKNLASTARSLYITKYRYKDRCNYLNNLLNIDNNGLNSFETLFDNVIDKSSIVVLGNKEEIEKDKELFDIIRPLVKEN